MSGEGASIKNLGSYDVVIVGAGPAGLAAAANAAYNKLSHLLIEKREIGNTIFDYQLGKHVMAEPQRLPLRGQVPFEAGTREEILKRWNESVAGHSVNICKAEVSKIAKGPEGFVIGSTQGIAKAKQVILAIGVQGTPRRLGVPGEDIGHVAYTLADPGAFTGQDILVVGAGDAAIENALALAEKNTVSLLNRSAEFPRAKEANVAKISDAIKKGKIRLFASAAAARIEPTTTYITTPEGEVALRCTHIIARLGGVLPRKFLEGCGIAFPSEDPAAVPVVNSKYESNVPGLYLLGALIGYPLIKHAMNQGYEVIEHILGREVEPADQVLVSETLRPLGSETNKILSAVRASLPFFNDLSDPQFRELIIESKIHTPKAGDVVFEKNDYTDTFYSIVQGSVQIKITEKFSVTLSAGEFFGEMGLLSGRRRAATVYAGKDAVLLESPRKQILKLNNAVAGFRKVLDQAFMLRALSSNVFPGADPSSLRELVTSCSMKRFKKGEVLFKEGDTGDAAYVIRKGSLKVSRNNKEGKEVTQTYLHAGNLVGEMALLSGGRGVRSATITAAVPCETIVLTKESFTAFIDQNPTVKAHVEKLVAARNVENITYQHDATKSALLDFMMREGVTDADNILIIDSDLCVGCDNCESACAATHNGYSRLDRKGGKNFASIQIPVSCRHCENPLCMLDCPPDALTRVPSGEVIIRDSCIGCGNCVRNCPYGVIQMVYDSEESEGFSLLGWLGLSKQSKEKGAAKAGKCDMCGHLSGGPACVRSCPTGAAMRINPRKLLQIVQTRGGSSHGL
jgi:thioredoxin reductase/CRP-like cAMP-binding protein/Fe-S-cluster-containing hydrogenase component 2